MSSQSARRRVEQERAAAARQAREQAERRRRQVRRRWAIGAGAGAAVAGLVTLGALTGTQTTPTSHGPVDHAQHATNAAGGRTDAPPWSNAADPYAATRAAGIEMAASEGTAEHYHAHLDVLVDGVPVPVAAGIGVDMRRQLMSPLHTHDGDGLIHVESPTRGTAFYLGQLFREWDVALDATRLGGLRVDATHTLTAYVNGVKVDGDPASIRIAADQEIAIVYGPAGQVPQVPSTFDFGDE